MGSSVYRGYNGSSGKGVMRGFDPHAQRFGKADRQMARRLLKMGAPPEKVAAHFGVPVRKVLKLREGI